MADHLENDQRVVKNGEKISLSGMKKELGIEESPDKDWEPKPNQDW